MWPYIIYSDGTKNIINLAEFVIEIFRHKCKKIFKEELEKYLNTKHTLLVII